MYALTIDAKLIITTDEPSDLSDLHAWFDKHELKTKPESGLTNKVYEVLVEGIGIAPHVSVQVVTPTFK